jgi:murein L,D-transpeptidase YafK
MRWVPALCLMFVATALCAPRTTNSFAEEQLTHPRVKAAAHEKNDAWRELFLAKNLKFPPQRLLLQAFKREAVLEVWASDNTSSPFTYVKSFRICASSGQLGPKRRFGDQQVPEGFYEIDNFNPENAFLLSLHVSYPNSSDRILGSAGNLGGDIFVHGNCVTIGCLPITDDGIKELYWLAVLARQSGQKHIPIWIFPARLTDDGFVSLAQRHKQEPELVAFWANLKECFDTFQKDHRTPEITVSPEGRYRLR